MDDDRKFRNLGSVTFDTNNTGDGALSILKNTIAVLADEIGMKGNYNRLNDSIKKK